jgi:hypothetical protein
VTHSLHFLSHEGIERAERSLREGGVSRLPGHLHRSRAWRLILDKGRLPSLKIITLTREPISRAIADTFENVRWRDPRLLAEHERMDINSTLGQIRARLANFDEESDYVCRWFDHELRSVFGLDVYEHDFDKERGYTTLIHEATRIPVMVIRMENLDAVMSDGLPSYLGLSEPIPILRANVGEGKWYGDAYRQVVESLRLSHEVCERIYSSRYVRHFYTEDEIATFIQRWTL